MGIGELELGSSVTRFPGLFFLPWPLPKIGAAENGTRGTLWEKKEI